MTAFAERFIARVARPRKLDLADPRITFSVVWLFGVALAQIRILDVQQPWSLLAWAVVFLVPASSALPARADSTSGRTRLSGFGSCR